VPETRAARRDYSKETILRAAMEAGGIPRFGLASWDAQKIAELALAPDAIVRVREPPKGGFLSIGWSPLRIVQEIPCVIITPLA